MARAALFLMLATILMAAGCRSQSVGMLPPPNLDAPRIVQRAQVRPANLAPVARPAVLAPRPQLACVPPEWIPHVQGREWRWIIVHHSATVTGGAITFDRMHRGKGWDELGYHFVIGNGTDTPDGLIEVGQRWPKQKWGAHAKTPDNRYNDYGIGICLVGNFNGARPTPAQMQSLLKLVTWLVSTYHIPVGNILGHGETKSTECPGHNVSMAEIRRQAAQLAARGQVQTNRR